MALPRKSSTLRRIRWGVFRSRHRSDRRLPSSWLDSAFKLVTVRDHAKSHAQRSEGENRAGPGYNHVPRGEGSEAGTITSSLHALPSAQAEM